MTLAVSSRIAGYEVWAHLGAGGMGEVYRAKDSKLGREVALKILPASFTNDPERVARFRREAQVLASLNHPHIAQIYGLEEANGTQFLVLELVDGESLDKRIARGPIPVAEALGIAKQIAEALEAAHEKGIIHRDLKPANIALTKEGHVKVLDFGLAKAIDTTSGSVDAMNSPTITSPAMMTGVGVILGTAAYMSPEQAKGRPADKRSDVWAFGCVLYEMLTGKRPFDGEGVSDTLAAVLRSEPDWAALPAGVSAPIATLLRRCLEKEARTRVADISIASFVLKHAAQFVERTGLSLEAVDAPRSRQHRAFGLAVAAIVAALAAGASVRMLTRGAAPAIVRTTLPVDDAVGLRVANFDREIAITPDGSRVVYRGANRLLVRALDRLEASVIVESTSLGQGVTSAAGPNGVFISPDGRWVGYVDGANILKKVPIGGGASTTISTVPGNPRGATWGEDGTIIFATNSLASGLLRVSAAGGEPTVLTKLDRGDVDHLWPTFLPGGHAVLYTVYPGAGAIDSAQIAVLDLQTGRSKVLINGGTDARYIPATGHLVYGAGGRVRAVAFDLRRLEVVGTPAPVLDGVRMTVQGGIDLAVAENGTLVYVPGGVGSGVQNRIVSVDRQGHSSELPGIPPDSYRDVRVSPDGSRIALATQGDVWTYDARRATLSRLTTNPAADTRPIWTPDGQRIIYTSNRAGYPELFSRAADGTGADERLVTRGNDLLDLRANTWSADGKQLLFTDVPPDFRCTIEQVAIDRPANARVLMNNEFCPDYASISPDGKWMAYHSRVSGRQEIYVERYPDLGARQLISTGGGMRPVWSRDGRQLFFSSLDARQIFAVPIQSGVSLVSDRPQMLFEIAMFQVSGGRPYDVGPDGRFVVIRSGQPDTPASANMILVQNWFEELKARVPTNRIEWR